MSRFVLDSSAIITFFENRSGADRVAELLREASSARTRLLMSVINWGEAYYSVWNTSGPGVARWVIGNIAGLPIAVIPVGQDQALLAAELKAEQKLPYADCFAASLALECDATLVTADSDFARLKKKLSLLLL